MPTASQLLKPLAPDCTHLASVGGGMPVSGLNQIYSIPAIEIGSRGSDSPDQAAVPVDGQITDQITDQISGQQPQFCEIQSLRPNLRASMLDGGFYGLTLGCGETFLPAFALAVGLGEVVSGLVTSLPIFFGGIVQLISLRALTWAGSYKKWIVAGVAMQAMTFLPLIAAAIYGSISSWAFFLVASIYWGTGLAAGPAWNAWIGHVVPEPIRANFFAKRTRIIQITTLIGFLIGGGLLQWTKGIDAVLWGFATLFIVAGLSRFACVGYLVKHRTSKADDDVHPERVRWMETWRGISPKSRNLIVYLICMQACVQFSGPYFVPYIIKQLNYSYTAFAIVIAAALVARILALNLWGRVARDYGVDKLLIIGGVGLLPLASLWILSPSLPWLIVVQMLSGLLWSAYELAFFLMFMEEIPQKRRASALTIFNFGNSCTWCLGALAGGWWLSHFGASIESYHGVFVISSLTRVLCVGLLWRVVRKPGPTPLSLDASILPAEASA